MTPFRISTTALVLAAMVAAAGCGGSGGGSGSTAATTNAAAPSASPSGGGVLVGAGSTFVAPLVSQWTGDYAKRANVTVTYGAVGSGAGIAAVTSGTVDFGASDAPLTPDQATACTGCVEIPWALGATSVAYHLAGAPQHLRLDGATIAGIFLGKITSWNDPAIARTNPGVSLPSTKITPVFRSDASGTSYNFTDYLSHVSGTFRSKVGTTTQPTFPTGEGAKGSSGVAGVVASTDGAITYVDIAYALTSHFQYAAVRNAANAWVLPTVASIRAAAAASKSVKPNAAVSIVEPPASASAAYPIATFTYVIVPRQSSKAQSLEAFLRYAVGTGQQFGPKLLFAPLPANVVAADRNAIAKLS